MQKAGFIYDGIILNAGGYTHTSVAIADAIKAIRTPVVEVHISNIFARESFRHVSLLSPMSRGALQDSDSSPTGWRWRVSSKRI